MKTWKLMWECAINAGHKTEETVRLGLPRFVIAISGGGEKNRRHNAIRIEGIVLPNPRRHFETTGHWAGSATNRRKASVEESLRTHLALNRCLAMAARQNPCPRSRHRLPPTRESLAKNSLCNRAIHYSSKPATECNAPDLQITASAFPLHDGDQRACSRVFDKRRRNNRAVFYSAETLRSAKLNRLWQTLAIWSPIPPQGPHPQGLGRGGPHRPSRPQTHHRRLPLRQRRPRPLGGFQIVVHRIHRPLLRRLQRCSIRHRAPSLVGWGHKRWTRRQKGWTVVAGAENQRGPRWSRDDHCVDNFGPPCCCELRTILLRRLFPQQANHCAYQLALRGPFGPGVGAVLAETGGDYVEVFPVAVSGHHGDYGAGRSVESLAGRGVYRDLSGAGVGAGATCEGGVWEVQREIEWAWRDHRWEECGSDEEEPERRRGCALRTSQADVGGRSYRKGCSLQHLHLMLIRSVAEVI